MTTSIIGASGQIVECNFEDKISELFDSLYIKVESIKEKYVDIINGVIIDKTKFNHIMTVLMENFNVKDCNSLKLLLNQLNTTNLPITHVKFFLDRFNLSNDLNNSIDKKLKDINKKNTNMYENIISIYSHYKDKELKDMFNKFVKSVESKQKENDLLKKNQDDLILLDSCNNHKDLTKIIDSIDKLQSKHKLIMSDITEIYKYINDMTNRINSIPLN
jgi:hypothetical protein